MLEIPRTAGYDVIDALIDAEHVARKGGDQLKGDRLEHARRGLERQMANSTDEAEGSPS